MMPMVFLILEKIIYFLVGLTIPLIVLKLLGIFSLTWLNVFTPILIALVWLVMVSIAAGYRNGMEAVNQHKNSK